MMIPCPLCGSTRHTLGARLSGVLNVRAQNVVCRGCGFAHRNPPWDEKKIENFYRSLSRYYRYTYQVDRLIGGIRERQEGQARQHAEWLKSHHLPAGERVLDDGSGCGYFVAAAVDEGYAAEGIDLDEEAVESAQQRGLSVSLDLFEAFGRPDGHFGAITMFDVLEHCAHLDTFLATAERLLAQDGLLFIEVPDAMTAREKLEHYLVPEHNWHFTANTLRHLLTKHGWQGVEMRNYVTPFQVCDALQCVARRPNEEMVPYCPSGPDEHDRLVAHFNQLRRDTRLPRAVRFRDGLTKVLGPTAGWSVYRGLIGLYVALKKAAGLYRYPEQ